MSSRAAVLIVLASSAVAAAAPPSIRLTRDQIAAATKAVQDEVLRTADHARADACRKQEPIDITTADAPALLSLGLCYRDARFYGPAIARWEQLLRRYPFAKEAEEAARQLGPAYEASGIFHVAAEQYSRFAHQHTPADDARGQLVRAVCLWQQLGFDDDAARDLEYLRLEWKKTPVDPDHLCDGVRPIQPPAP